MNVHCAHPLSQVLQLVRGSIGSLTYCTWQGKGGGHLSIAHATTQQPRGVGPALLFSWPHGWLTCAPASNVSILCCPGEGQGLLSRVAATREGQCQLLHSYDPGVCSHACFRWWGWISHLPVLQHDRWVLEPALQCLHSWAHVHPHHQG